MWNTAETENGVFMAYIIDGLRSYIGIENSMYRHISAEQLGAGVLDRLAERTGIDKVDCIIAGNAVGAGGNIARVMSLSTVFGVETPAFTVDMQCGSSLESIALAAAKIDAGQADKVAKFMPGTHRQTAMLDGAELTAADEKISREEMNEWILRSHRLAKEARDKGVLKDVVVSVADGCDKDEGIRDRMSEKLLNRLPAILENGNIITAGNACLTNDGAAFVILCSEKYVRENNCEIKGEFIDIAETGGTPDRSPKSCIAAIEKILKRNSLSPQDIDVYECNEAFAVIDVLFARTFPEQVSKYNVFGGALAYGHPYGASGAIITLHALRALELKGGGYAVCGIAAAGGVGSAILLKK